MISCVISTAAGCKKKYVEKTNAAPVVSNASAIKKNPYVIMISIDGFRADYLNRPEASDLKNLAATGIEANYMIPSYPSSTFANHTTLSTGLYPDRHGIIDNRFYERNNNELFDASKQYNGKWFFGLPIWELALQHYMVPYCSYWFGAGATRQGPINENLFIKYNKEANKKQSTLINRVNNIVAELKKPDHTRPHFIAFYISQVDEAGHATGPYSPQTNAAIKVANDAIKLLHDKITTDKEVSQLPINYIVVSDHGMTEANTTQTIAIPEVDRNKFLITTDETMLQIYGLNHDETMRQQEIETLFTKLEADRVSNNTHHNNYNVVRKKNNPYFAMGGVDPLKRIGDILLVAKAPYQFYNPFVNNGKTPNPKKPKVGCHGYDPKDKDMHATFFAWGPAFNVDKIDAFQNIHVYPLVVHILGLKYTHVIDGNAKVLVNSKVLKN